jgi:ParB family chromosome partitioning protein
LLDRMELTQEDLAKKLGKDRSSLANTLRLLNLPKEIQQEIEKGVLSSGHGRALLSLQNVHVQAKAMHFIKNKKCSVRETEEYVKKLQRETKLKPKGTENINDPEFEHVQNELCKYYGTQVKIMRHGKGGKIQIYFYSWNDLDRLHTLLTR